MPGKRKFRKKALRQSARVRAFQAGRSFQRGCDRCLHQRPRAPFPICLVGHTRVITGNETTDVDRKGISGQMGVQFVVQSRLAVCRSKSGAELLFEVFSQRYERGSTPVTSNLPFPEWTEDLRSERPTRAP